MPAFQIVIVAPGMTFCNTWARLQVESTVAPTRGAAGSTTGGSTIRRRCIHGVTDRTFLGYGCDGRRCDEAHWTSGARDATGPAPLPAYPDPHGKSWTAPSGRQGKHPAGTARDGNNAALARRAAWFGTGPSSAAISNHRVLRWSEDDGRERVPGESGYSNGHSRDSKAADCV